MRLSDEYKALANNVVWTFVDASLGVFVADSIFNYGIDAWKIAAGTGLAAVVVVVRSFANKHKSKAGM